MSTSKKRRVITLAEKKAIIEAAETETNKTKLAERFGLAFGTLCWILKEKEAILGAIVGGSQLKAGKHEQMEEDLIELKKWDNKLKKEIREVLLYLDNCSAHPLNVKLDNIRVKFFPPNTTVLSQPMDQGVIQNLKVHYRKLLLRVCISELEAGKNFKVSLLDSLHMLRRAWEHVTEETIKNCFRHVNFIHKEEPANEEEEADEWAPDQNEEFLNAWNELQYLATPKISKN